MRPCALIVVLLLAWPSTGFGEGRRLLEACSRGNVETCHAVLRQPRLHPGTRLAVVHHLEQIQEWLSACDRGESAGCDALIERLPDLAAAVRAAVLGKGRELRGR